MASLGSMSEVCKCFFKNAVRMGWTREIDELFSAPSSVVACASGLRTDAMH